MLYLPYAGIGSRETPSDILVFMTEIARYLEVQGYTLRSGGCVGPDQAFASGVSTYELYVPWNGYNGLQGHTPTSEGLNLAAAVHPNWAGCSRGAKLMHGRNSHIVMGPNLDSLVKFVVCWTKNGRAMGGTGQGIRMAEECGVPVHNLKNNEHYVYWKELLNDSVSTTI